VAAELVGGDVIDDGGLDEVDELELVVSLVLL